MSINDRVREIRNALDLTQKEFGQKITLAQTYLSQIEKGDRDVTEKIQKLICLQFNVNEEWLRTGKGEMFIEDDHALVAQLAKQYNLDDFSRQFIETYVGLPEEQRAAIKNFAYAIAKKKTDAEISTELSPVPSERKTLTESEIDAEVESYRKELEIEKSIKTSSASQDTGKKIS